MPFTKLLKKKRKTAEKASAGALAVNTETGLNVSAKAPAASVEHRYTPKLTYDELLNAESALGRTLFGPVPNGHQREFFVLKHNVWMWYENWIDETGAFRETSLRYEVRPDGVYKRYMGGAVSYAKIEGAELDNFVTAARSYYNLVKTKLYR